eukprot:4197515-Prymnesium_polylepis.1
MPGIIIPGENCAARLARIAAIAPPPLSAVGHTRQASADSRVTEGRGFEPALRSRLGRNPLELRARRRALFRHRRRALKLLGEGAAARLRLRGR